MIDRERYLDDYGTQVDPLFDIVDSLIDTVKKSQSILAEYLPPDSDLTQKQVIDNLLGVLDDKILVSLLIGLET